MGPKSAQNVVNALEKAKEPPLPVSSTRWAFAKSVKRRRQGWRPISARLKRWSRLPLRSCKKCRMSALSSPRVFHFFAEESNRDVIAQLLAERGQLACAGGGQCGRD
jgi:DNA ligase (NAD+)